MPSNAYKEYQRNLTDVHRLVVLHRRESGTNRGRRGLGHLTRGGLLLLCAAWERYVETVLYEGAEFLTQNLTGFHQLPANIRIKVTNHANNPSTPWTAAQLTTATWTQIYLDAVNQRIDKLNTPKHHKLKVLFDDFLAIPDIGSYWSGGTTHVDDFVKLRGEVAHRGAQSQYIKFHNLVLEEKEITKYAKETDNALSDHIKKLLSPTRRPWNRIL